MLDTWQVLQGNL